MKSSQKLRAMTAQNPETMTDVNRRSKDRDKTVISISVYRETVEGIRAMAEIEQRNFSSMCSVLLQYALDNREPVPVVAEKRNG